MSTEKIDTEALHELLGGAWEYKVLTGLHFHEMQEWLTVLGNERWELVTAWQSGSQPLFSMIFKRRKSA
jgi:hypothetical protein